MNGSVYNQNVRERLDGTTEDFYPSLAECVAAVEAGKEDAAVQLSYCCQLAVNRRPGTVALLPEPVAEVSEGFFFPKGSPLTAQFNELMRGIVCVWRTIHQRARQPVAGHRRGALRALRGGGARTRAPLHSGLASRQRGDASPKDRQGKRRDCGWGCFPSRDHS